MTYDDLPYLIQPMQVQDIPEVMEIERVCFSMPWSTRAYRYEIEENRLSTYMVARVAVKTQADGLWDRVREMLSGGPAHSPVIGYGGFWMMVDEAHISTLAVTPAERGKGIGELLLMRLIKEAEKRGANVVTLEVRVSNLPAQGLYEKYGFTVQGRRVRYYSDNGEDALILTTPRLDSPPYAAHLASLKTQLSTRLAYEPPVVEQN